MFLRPRPLLIAVSLAALLVSAAPPLRAAAPIRISPSPDGRYLFLRGDASAGQAPLDLVERATGKVLQHIVAAAPNAGFLGQIVWKPDSTGFALALGTSRFDWLVSVYQRSGAAFIGVDLPELPEAVIPEEYGPDTELKHWSAMNGQKPVRWQKDGSLLVEITSTADNGHASATARRTVVLDFPTDSPARILSSTLKVTHHD